MTSIPCAPNPESRSVFVQPGEAIPGDAALVIIPGSKSTIADLAALRSNGWDIDLAAHRRRGGRVLGLCGGYQMLGRRIHDPQGLEGPAQSVEGLGLLDVETTLLPDKTVTETEGTHLASNTAIRAYEIHLGKTGGADCSRPFARTARGTDGAVSPDGRVMGTYLHGCFTADDFRAAFVTMAGGRTGGTSYDHLVETTLDALAAHLESCVNLSLLLDLATAPKITA
jgi:adenosylcobyric acid synthase